jgi:hypothetical protein
LLTIAGDRPKSRAAGKALGVHDLDEHRAGGEPIHRPIRIFHHE